MYVRSQFFIEIYKNIKKIKYKNEKLSVKKKLISQYFNIKKFNLYYIYYLYL